MKNVAQETEKAISGAIKIDEKEIRDHLDGLVRQINLKGDASDDPLIVLQERPPLQNKPIDPHAAEAPQTFHEQNTGSGTSRAERRGATARPASRDHKIVSVFNGNFPFERIAVHH